MESAETWRCVLLELPFVCYENPSLSVIRMEGWTMEIRSKRARFYACGHALYFDAWLVLLPY